MIDCFWRCYQTATYNCVAVDDMLIRIRVALYSEFNKHGLGSGTCRPWLALLRRNCGVSLPNTLAQFRRVVNVASDYLSWRDKLVVCCALFRTISIDLATGCWYNALSWRGGLHVLHVEHLSLPWFDVRFWINRLGIMTKSRDKLSQPMYIQFHLLFSMPIINLGKGEKPIMVLDWRRDCLGTLEQDYKDSHFVRPSSHSTSHMALL